MGAPAGGMNAATRAAVRYSIRQGHKPLAISNGFKGLLDDSVYELSWLGVDNWTVRGGYIFSVNTVPTSTFGPSVPDSNRHVFSIGGGYQTKRMCVDLVYQYSLSVDRTVNNGTAADGTWQSDSQAVMVTSTLKF